MFRGGVEFRDYQQIAASRLRRTVENMLITNLLQFVKVLKSSNAVYSFSVQHSIYLVDLQCSVRFT